MARKRCFRIVTLFSLVALLAGAGTAFAEPRGAASRLRTQDPLAWEAEQELYVPVKAWIAKLKESKNAFGKENKQAVYSKIPHKIDDSTYEVTVHVNTAEETRQVTERYTLTVRQADKKWSIGNEKLEETYVGLFRESGVNCYPFEKFSFDREGLAVNATKGSMCEAYVEGKVSGFGVHGDTMSYAYAPPAHAGVVLTGHDFSQLHKLNSRDHAEAITFDPVAFWVRCDAVSCEELITGSFTGLKRVPAEERSAATFASTGSAGWATAMVDRWVKERREDAFAHFRPLDFAGHLYYSLFIARELEPLTYGGILDEALPGSGVVLAYDNWSGWEVTFAVYPRRIDIPEQLVGEVYGYFSEATLASSDQYQLERRDDAQSRWHEVRSVVGNVNLAVDDPETVSADVEFGLTLKQDTAELPFWVNTTRPDSTFGSGKPAPLSVNSVQFDGKELTWVKTGTSSGRLVLPEPMAAGTELTLRVNFETRGIIKYTHSYSYLNRFGWIPFVGFGDFIDEFDLVVKSPAQYTILGVGHKESEQVQGDVRISHWVADQPVVFPTIIFGKYRSDKPRIEAKKADGTVIPVEVFVDEASFSEEPFPVPFKNLRSIAEQAVNAINLYTEISGVEYPYGELNFVNDPKGFLYGQAPSSLIFLGSGVFRGEGFLAPYFTNATGISKFLKSVVAHEVGHQWWGSRVSNANFRNYWFVESLAEYFSAIYLEAVFGWTEYEEQVDEWRRNILDTRLKTGVQNASSLFSGEDGFRSYQSAVYNKGPYAFHILRETFKGPGPRGPEAADKKFFDALKVMSQELAKTREIVTLDMQRAAEKAFGGVDAEGNEYTADMGWFFDQWIRGTGLPQFTFDYKTRETEDGSWIVEGLVRQKVVVGNKRGLDVLDGQFYRGRTSITVVGSDKKEYPFNLIVDGPEVPFAFKVPAKPRSVELNKHGEMLTADTIENQGM